MREVPLERLGWRPPEILAHFGGVEARTRKRGAQAGMAPPFSRLAAWTYVSLTILVASACTAAGRGQEQPLTPVAADDAVDVAEVTNGDLPAPPTESPREEATLRSPQGIEMRPCEAAPPGMACVLGGPFKRGRNDGRENERPEAEVWLQTYYMDLHEVTYAAYKACQRAGACPRGGPLYNDFSRAAQPITGVTWFGARAYCASVGKHLPTEAQWEKAARGPEGALYPWGDDEVTCERAIIKDARGRSCGVKKRKEHPDKGRTFEVGSRPPGVYGLYDMIGNSWEWVYDWSAKDYAACGEACAGTDPLGPCQGADVCPGHTERVVRGGSWYWDKNFATATYRRTHVPHNDPFHHFGFRCAATVDEARALLSGVTERAPAQGEEAAEGFHRQTTSPRLQMRAPAQGEEAAQEAAAQGAAAAHGEGVARGEEAP